LRIALVLYFWRNKKRLTAQHTFHTLIQRYKSQTPISLNPVKTKLVIEAHSAEVIRIEYAKLQCKIGVIPFEQSNSEQCNTK